MHSLGRLFLLPTILVLAFILLPVVIVIGVALDPSPAFRFPPHAISLRWFASFFASHDYVHAFFVVSLPLGLVVAIAATIIGTAAAVTLDRRDLPARRLLNIAMLMPLIVPQILLAVGIYLVYARLGINPGLLSLAAAQTVIACPYVIRTVLAGLAGIDPRIAEAARNLGAHPVRAFMLTTLPQLASGIIAGALFAFIVSLGDINLALFLSGAGSSTLSVLLLGEMQHAADPTLAAAAALQVIVVGAALLVIQRMFGRLRW